MHARPRRVAIYGPSGSGKSTLARRVGEALGLPVCELDALVHANPGWVDASREEVRARLEAFFAAHPDGWVIDGNYTGMVQDLILPRADLLVWLRLPFRTVYPRLAVRTFRRRLRNELLWGTNRESLRVTLFSRDSILWWGLSNWRPHHRRMRQLFRARPPHVPLRVLRSPREVRAFEAELRTLARAERHRHGESW